MWRDNPVRFAPIFLITLAAFAGLPRQSEAMLFSFEALGTSGPLQGQSIPLTLSFAPALAPAAVVTDTITVDGTVNGQQVQVPRATYTTTVTAQVGNETFAMSGVQLFQRDGVLFDDIIVPDVISLSAHLVSAAQAVITYTMTISDTTRQLIGLAEIDGIRVLPLFTVTALSRVISQSFFILQTADGTTVGRFLSVEQIPQPWTLGLVMGGLGATGLLARLTRPRRTRRGGPSTER
jgi:hypothetical protein